MLNKKYSCTSCAALHSNIDPFHWCFKCGVEICDNCKEVKEERVEEGEGLEEKNYCINCYVEDKGV